MPLPAVPRNDAYARDHFPTLKRPRPAEDYTCKDCGETFTGEGSVHGQPAALWGFLEHLDTTHHGQVPDDESDPTEDPKYWTD